MSSLPTHGRPVFPGARQAVSGVRSRMTYAERLDGDRPVTVDEKLLAATEVQS